MEKFNINAFKNLTNAGVKINEENQILFIENNIKNLMDSKIDSSVVIEQHIKEYIKQYHEYYDSAFVYIADKKHLSHLKTEIMIEYIIHYNEDKYAFNNYVNSITDENIIKTIISRSVKSLLKFKDSILYSKAVEFAIELHPISSITINWSTVSDINKIKALVKDKYCFYKIKACTNSFDITTILVAAYSQTKDESYLEYLSLVDSSDIDNMYNKLCSHDVNEYNQIKRTLEGDE